MLQLASLSSQQWIHQYVPKHIWIAQNAQRLGIAANVLIQFDASEN